MKQRTDDKLTFFVQYPICDVRPLLLLERNGLKPLPTWKNPVPNRQFLQYFGHLMRRKRSDGHYFHDELYFISGRGGIKLPNLNYKKKALNAYIEDCLTMEVLP